MPEWMRSQFMAPVYALLISLSVALALAAAMNSAEVNILIGPAGHERTVHLVPWVIYDNEPPVRDSAAQLKVSQVTVQRTVTVQQASTTVDEGGVNVKVPADGRLKVCVTLPAGWTGFDATSNEAPQTPCWMVDPGTKPVSLNVSRKG